MTSPGTPLVLDKEQLLALLQAQRFAEAKTAAEALCRAQPQDAEAWQLLGVAHGALGESETAEGCFRRAIKFAPDYLKAHRNLALALIRQHKTQEAIESLQAVTRLDPKDTEAHYSLGNLFYDAGNLDAATTAYRVAVRLNPDYLEARLDLSLALRTSGKRKEAIQCLQEALNIQPDCAPAHYHLGDIWREQGRWIEAEACYQAAIRARADYPEAWFNLGVIATMAGKHAKAVELFSRALVADPSSNNTRFNLAASLKSAGRRTEALALFQYAWKCELDPSLLSAGDFGVRELARRFCTDPIGPWANRLNELSAYAELIEEQGAFRGLEPLLDEVRASVTLADANPTELQVRLYALLSALGFLKTSDKQWSAKVFHALALPWMKEALALGYHDLALKLEGMVYNNYVKQTETEEHFRNCFNRWVPAMREAGQRAGAGLGPVSWPEGNGVPVVGFFLHSASLLAHVEVLINMLEGWTRLDAKPFIPRVYAFSGSSPPMVERFAKLGVPVVLLEQSCPEAGQDWYRRLLCLREHCAEDRATVLVWVSLALMMPFAFALRLAPVQIWWAMKYHGLEFEEIDGYVTGGGVSEYKEIGSRVWRNGRNSFTDLYKAELSPEAQKVRAHYVRFDVILGTFGREDKLNSETFLESVAAILRSSPNAAFLWTGRTRLAAIQRKFEDSGVAKQCFFLGWVNTKLYAQVVDIFLDSFPFPCGLTVMEAMAAGKPAILYVSNEAYETGLHGMITPMLKKEVGTVEEQDQVQNIFQPRDHESLYFCAGNAQEYVSFALRLIQDPALRRRSGSAYKSFVEIFLQDTRKTGVSYSNHFLGIVEECRKRSDSRTDESR